VVDVDTVHGYTLVAQTVSAVRLDVVRRQLDGARRLDASQG